MTSGLLATQSLASVVLTHAGNQIGAFQASTTGAGNIEFNNVGVLEGRDIKVVNGNLALNNIGGIRTSGAIVASNGSVTLSAHSPITIGTPGITATGNITLTAANAIDGNMTLNGPITSSAGSVALTAASNYVQNAPITAASGVAASAGGLMTFGAGASTDGSPVSYSAAGQLQPPPPATLAAQTASSDLASQTAVLTNSVVAFTDTFADTVLAQDFSSSVQVASASTSNASATEAKPAEPDPLKERKKNKENVVVEGKTCTP